VAAEEPAPEVILIGGGGGLFLTRSREEEQTLSPRGRGRKVSLDCFATLAMTPVFSALFAFFAVKFFSCLSCFSWLKLFFLPPREAKCWDSRHASLAAKGRSSPAYARYGAEKSKQQASLRVKCFESA
jgi:hypothetical protein